MLSQTNQFLMKYNFVVILFWLTFLWKEKPILQPVTPKLNLIYQNWKETEKNIIKTENPNKK